MQRLLQLLVVFVLIGQAGCEEGKKPLVMHPVSGEIQYDGKAVAGIRIYLLPTSAPMPPEIPTNPNGVTDEQGKFSIGTFTKSDGAAEGGYMILLMWPPEKKPNEESSEEPSEDDRLLGWYDAAHSQLSVVVKEGQNQIPTIKIPLIKGPPPKSDGIPGRN